MWSLSGRDEAGTRSPWNGSEPIREELFSTERLEQHAAALAADQRVRLKATGGVSLRRRVLNNALVLRISYEQIAGHSGGERTLTPAADWFLDNYYLVERQLRMVRDDLPPGFYRELPKLRDGRFAGYPRILALAWELVAHTDSAFDSQTLIRFVDAYQRLNVLTIGELWALATMLRVVLIENLRRCAERLVSGRRERDEADAMADRLLGTPARPPEAVNMVVADWARHPLPPALAVQLVRRFRDADRSTTPGARWLDERLSEENVSADVLVQQDLRGDSAANVTVRNIVTSLIALSASNWADVVEALSVVDATLRAASRFAGMDFATRNRYRSAIEDLAVHSRQGEVEVARRALAAASMAEAPAPTPAPETDPTPGSSAATAAVRDPGFYLIGDGRLAFEAGLGYRPPVRVRLRRLVTGGGIRAYLGIAATAALGLLIGSAALVERAYGLRGASFAGLLAFLALVAFPLSDALLALLNVVYARLVPPRLLPALDLEGTIPDTLRTLVVMPVLMTTAADLEELLTRLESHYLASARGELYFALLVDGVDAIAETMPGDAPLLEQLRSRIDRLNARYPTGSGSARFLGLSRARRWNDAQGCWMGWERKRGKLLELNRLLRGARDTSFRIDEEDYARIPRDIRFVLVLDADTQLPPAAAERLIGKLAHPLNRPEISPGSARVRHGYAVIQPRVAPTLPGGDGHSLLQQVLSNSPGLDPYSFANSDLYQDLCGEGSFTGKGIYDLDAFERALEGRLPENAILSHDLLEGILARSALASDVEVFEAAPDRYDVASAREHRWARGDWQLLPWLLRPPAARAPRAATGKLSLLDRWKILDNLRRSLVPPATFAALVVAGFQPLDLALRSTALLLLILAVPPLLPACSSAFHQWPRLGQASGRRSVARELRLALLQWVLSLTVVADRAWQMGDAVVRTLVRLTVTRRHLLDWTSAAQSRRSSQLTLGSYARGMARSVSLALLAGLAVAIGGSAAGVLVAPWVGIWVLAPLLAWQISLPRAMPEETPPTDAQLAALRLVARRTWGYFERFVTAGEQYLPPDNYQETPVPVVAHRTSPTNIGLYLLASAGAFELGWLGLLDWIERLEATFATLARLERHRGHFYNWYDTQTLSPLLPTYISTVDSGNVVGHLLALANALDAAVTRPLWTAERIQGIRDGLVLATSGTGIAPADPEAWTSALARPLEGGETVVARLGSLAALARDATDAAARTARSHARDLDLLLPIESSLADAAGADVPERDAVAARGLIDRLGTLAGAARRCAYGTEFAFLLDPKRMLFSIGYRVAEAALDTSHYDLLASEARLASFIAVAKRDVPPRHWFRLGRGLVPVEDGAALVSWAGSMFEYLMPALVMSEPAGSLLGESSRAAVRAQRDYGTARGLPWGVSESAYNQRDREQTYQYLTFGVPALGLRRVPNEEAVVAPYATALAAMVDPGRAADNLRDLESIGAHGAFGYYEAVDFTPSRLADGERQAIVRAYMAHHQGMTVVALANLLRAGIFRDYFHSEPVIRAMALLLQEKPPLIVDEPLVSAVPRSSQRTAATLATVRRRRMNTWRPQTPQSQLLSNGRYSVIVNANGAGGSRWRGIEVYRSDDDTTRSAGGQGIYLRDVASDAIWSAGFQPARSPADSYRATFSEDRVEIVRRDGALTSTLEILVSPEHDAEARRLTITNEGLRTREIDVTSYGEIVLTTGAADRAHRTFSNLFVETEYLADLEALLASRRRRAAQEPAAFAAHLVVTEGETVGEAQYECDRGRFLGRNSSSSRPRALLGNAPLSGTAGIVLDPILSLRRRVRLARGASARLTFWTAVGESREQVLQTVDKCREATAFTRASTLAWTHAQVRLHHLGLDPEDAILYQRLATHIADFDPAMRARAEILLRNDTGPWALWAHGISGDLPLVVVEVDDPEQDELVRQLLRAREYWRLMNLIVDLVVINETPGSYSEDLQSSLETLVRTSAVSGPVEGEPAAGRIYVLRADRITPESRQAISTAARVLLVGRRGSLREQLAQRENALADPTPLSAGVPVPSPSAAPGTGGAHTDGLELFNGLGGFADSGREYVVVLGPGQHTPLPWINVIAQPGFGFQVSADGGGFTWSQNSRENALTTWSNDPIADPAAEAIYLRDEETGDLWCPTATPIRDPTGTYVARHGYGYTRFEHQSRGIGLELLQFVPKELSIKVSRLTIRNPGGRARRLSVCAYAEWSLGASRPAQAPFIITERCEETGALLARNPWNPDSGRRLAFLDMGGAQTSGTADRREFLGPNGSLEAPLALTTRSALSMRTGGGLDPCAVLMTRIEIAPGGSTEVIVLLGQADDRESVASLIRRGRALNREPALQEVIEGWTEMLGTVQVATPDRSFDLMLNGWLLYQTLSCRMWARAAFYQASGAYGFRDQLQDSLALCVAAPRISREQIVRAAGRQFPEGDVQHWWMPRTGRGVRTRVSDDRAWLAWCTARYVATTGDAGIWDEPLPFLTGPALAADATDAYFEPGKTAETASVFEHCARALDASLAVGAHGLPLIGTGDWNDGMNAVGAGGRGESVWLGWFLCAALDALVPIALQRGETERGARWQAHSAALRSSLEQSGWDGDWYRRGYFDDGSPLGSAQNSECRIDSIAQSWAVLSGVANPARAAHAMAAVDESLLRTDDQLALLFTPPFSRGVPDPGYIAAYPPGIRENGGQYTHAAIWSLMAYAQLRDGDRAKQWFDVLNPLHHSRDAAAVQRYQLEPYVVAADIYSAAGQVGRGGWSWYTGSAGWLYRAGLESILGFNLMGDTLCIDPCIPRSWRRFEITFRFRSTLYRITVTNPFGVTRGVNHAEVDHLRILRAPLRLDLTDDGVEHSVRVVMG